MSLVDPIRYYRRVIHITGDDSPNVILAKQQIARGEEPTGEMVIPGVLSWDEYSKRRARLDPKEQAVSLDAKFYKGAEVYLFPSTHLTICLEKAAALQGTRRRGLAMGVDSAEGGDNSCWTVVDDLGLVFQHSQKTRDTSDVPGITIGFMREWGVDPEAVLFDRGGGGQQHADVLRRRGFKVRSIGFGEKSGGANKEYRTATVIPRSKKLSESETRYIYKNRRAEIYGLLSISISEGFAIPSSCTELFRQLRLMPKLYDSEGQLYLPPKDRPKGSSEDTYKGATLKKMLGCSPDESDSFGLANYSRLRPVRGSVAGAVR